MASGVSSGNVSGFGTFSSKNKKKIQSASNPKSAIKNSTDTQINMNELGQLVEEILMAMSKEASPKDAWKNASLKFKLLATFNTKDKARVLGQRLVDLGAITQVQFDTITKNDKPHSILSGRFFQCYMMSDNPDLSKLNDAIIQIGEEQNVKNK